MKNFAKIYNNEVINIFIADDDFDIELLKDDGFFYVEITNTDNAIIGGKYIDKVFYPPRPFESWNKNEKNEWLPPIAKPIDTKYTYVWNESNLNWDTMYPMIYDEKTDTWNEDKS